MRQGCSDEDCYTLDWLYVRWFGLVLFLVTQLVLDQILLYFELLWLWALILVMHLVTKGNVRSGVGGRIAYIWIRTLSLHICWATILHV